MIASVPAGHAFVVERLGRYHRTLPAGTHFLVPLIDRVAFRFPLTPRDAEVTETAITLDNVAVKIAANVRAQIVDPQAAAYGTADVAEFVKTIVRTHLRNEIAKRNFEDARETTRELQAAVLRAVAEGEVRRDRREDDRARVAKRRRPA